MNAKSNDAAALDPETGEIGGAWEEQAATSLSPEPEASRSAAERTGKRSNGNTKKSSGGGEPERIVTLTLASIDPARRPDPSTVCEVCPAAVWMATPRDVKCFCRLMHYWSWETSKPNELTHCDGLAIASEKED